METHLADKDSQTLITEMFECMGHLHDLFALLPTPAQRAAFGHLDRIKDIHSELNTRRVVDLLAQAEVVDQLANHGRRTEAFLVHTLVICAKADFIPVGPVAESYMEYQEAWRNRQLPSRAEFRTRFEQRLRAKKVERNVR